MTPAEKAENLMTIKKLWAAFAAYYQVSLSDVQVRMYAEDCENYPARAIGEAMTSWRRNPKHLRLPLPGQLLQLIDGGTSRSNAAAIALSLIGAVKKHDYTWPMMSQPKFYKTGSFEGDFKQELGEVAWEVVRMAGGWSSFCGSFWDCGNETAFRAQIRDAIEDVIEKKRNGDHRNLTALPRPEDESQDGPRGQLGELVRQITEKGSA